MKRIVVLISLAALLLAGTASAAVKKGDLDVEAAGSWAQLKNDEGGGSTDILMATGSVGYFVTDAIQVGVAGLGAWIKPSGSDNDIDIYAIGVNGKYHFMTDKQWVPYVGAQIMTGSVKFGDTTNNGMIYGANGGVRCELTPVTDLFIEAQYNLTSGDLKDKDKANIKDIMGIFFGLAHKWR
jgi:hypothetical protein